MSLLVVQSLELCRGATVERSPTTSAGRTVDTRGAARLSRGATQVVCHAARAQEEEGEEGGAHAHAV